MKKTIALFVDGLSVPAKEGLTAHHIELAEHLSATEGWHPLMIVADRNRAAHEELKRQKFDTVLLPADEYYSADKIAAVLTRYNVAVAQNYNPHYFSTILAPAARRLGIPTLYEVHDFEKDLAFMNNDDDETAVNSEAQRASILAATHTRIMSRHDYEQLLAEYDDLPKERITWLPFGATLRPIERDEDAKNILFIGNSSYPPNAEACRWIIEEIAPRMPDVRFHLIGRDTDTFAAGSNVVTHGEVDDLEPWLKTTAVGIAPIKIGSGMKIKLLTYLSAGIPCVATTTAMAGFPQDDQAISVADEAEEFVEAIYEKLRDSKASVAAARYFDKYFDATTMFAKVEKMYETAASTRYEWQMPEVGDFDPSRLHWLKEAANACFGKTVMSEFHILGTGERMQKPILVVEGLPGAGKTSLINKLRDYAPMVGFVDEVPFEITGNDEKEFYQNDITKSRLAEALSADYVVMDRNYCSTLAYAYAQSKMTHDEAIYDKAERWVNEQLESGALVQPSAYIYIAIDPEVSVKRRRQASSDWMDVQFASYAAEWYENYFGELRDCPAFSYQAMMPTEELAHEVSTNQRLLGLTFS